MMQPFGKLSDGRAVEAITLGDPDGLQAEVLTYGGILRRLTFPSRGVRRELVLTLPDIGSYERDTSYLGALVGRVANRIANARFELDGRRYTLTANEGRNQLHGGKEGFGKRLWRVRDVQRMPARTVWLELHSPDGDEGYPGNLDALVRISVEGAVMEVRFEAQVDAPTPVSLTWHPYLNLSGDPSRAVEEMTLCIPAAAFLPVRDTEGIPTGAVAPVAGSPFDFRQARPIGPVEPSSHPQLKLFGGYDHCFVLDSERPCDALLASPASGVRLTLRSDRPGLQFYGGQYLPKTYPGWSGACLEPQGFPNAVNEPAFPGQVVRPPAMYESVFRYEFSGD